MVGCILAGAACGLLAVGYGGNLLAPVPGPDWLPLLSIAGLPLFWFVVVGFHEIGHVIGGWIGGGSFLLWAVGPFLVRRTPAGIRLAWNRSVNLTGGMAISLPLNPAQVTPRRVAVMIATGPVASLLVAIGAFLLADWLAAGAARTSPACALGQNFLVIIAGLSLLVFLISALPRTTGGFKTDGKRVMELMQGDHRSEQEAALIALTSADLAGLRPAEYDAALVAKTVSLGDGSMFDLYGRLTVYYHAADRGDWPAAQAHLDRVTAGLDKLPPFVRDIVRCEYAWLLATQTHDAAMARAWLESAGKLDFDPSTRLRAEAAVLLAEGKAAEAAAKAQDGLRALEHRSLSPVKSPFALDTLNTLLRRAKR
jgi:hypothetical protein